MEKDKLEKNKFKEIVQSIMDMVEVDQEMRGKNLKDPYLWDEDVDKTNTKRMKEIIESIGWPTISKVGKEASSGAWLLVQHADHDAGFQRKCLDMMKELSHDEIDRRDIALLEDRVLLKEKGYQLYGTQYTQEGNRHIPMPIHEPERVDERRKEMGLDTLEENIARMHKKYPMSDR
jgi:hypothetical protein